MSTIIAWTRISYSMHWTTSRWDGRTDTLLPETTYLWGIPQSEYDALQSEVLYTADMEVQTMAMRESEYYMWGWGNQYSYDVQIIRLVEQWVDVPYEDWLHDGTDMVLSSINYILAENVEHLTLTGTAEINGAGNAMNNSMVGNSAANELFGDAGDDTLSGGAGVDSLTGGQGSDRFVLNELLGADSVDALMDFNRVEGDTIALDDAVFIKLAGKTNLINHFRMVTQAADGDDFIVYNAGTGQLFYDDSGSGINTTQLFATLANQPQSLTGGAFMVM